MWGTVRAMVRGRAALALLLCLLLPSTVAGAPVAQTFAPGAVVALAGTTHLWIADDQGVLHWGGDTRGLAGKHIAWGTRSEVSAEQLKGFRRGDPWLSAGLLKLGDPIYLVKWESDQAAPTLLHIQSILDVELFGIDGSNYGAFVLDQETWERRFAVRADALPRGTLPPAVQPTPTPVPAAPTPRPVPQLRLVEVRKLQQTCDWETTLELTGARPGARLEGGAGPAEYLCAIMPRFLTGPGWGSADTSEEAVRRFLGIGSADASGRLVWKFRDSGYGPRRFTVRDADDRRTVASLVVPAADRRLCPECQFLSSE